MPMPMSGRQWASLSSLGLCALLAGASLSVAERVQLSPGRGCYEISSRAACCMFVDGRTDTPYGGQECIPTSEGVFFDDVHKVVCEPACFVGGSCRNDPSPKDLTALADFCVAGRKPVAAGCFTIPDREACCEHRDAREDPTFSGQDCVPSKADVPFVEAYGNVCEPKCWVDGTCNADTDIIERAGTCETPTPMPPTTVPTTTPAMKEVVENTTTTTITTMTATSTTTHTTQALGSLYLEQENATVPAGGDLSFFIVASSTGAWQTWPDQLHATLKAMGYAVTVPEPTFPGWLAQPTRKPICLDDADYAELSTPRFGMVGWSSWGFAFDDQADCNAEGYRPVLSYNISCTNAWACNYAWRNRDADYLSAAKMAQDFKGMKFVVLSNWINDAKTCDTSSARSACLPDADIEGLGSLEITSYTVPKLINKIHEEDPEVVVLVLARYADTSKTIYVNTRTLEKVAMLNAGVKAAVQDLPNTYFVDISFPLDVNMFQTKSKVHPNCRGDKVIVNSIVQALFEKKVLGRGLAMAGEECLPRTDCEDLSYACCHKSALCYVKDGKCSPYTPGEQ